MLEIEAVEDKKIKINGCYLFYGCYWGEDSLY